MNQKLQDMARRVREGTHRMLRQSQAPDVLTTCEDQHLSWLQRSAYLTRSLCDDEKVVIAPGERIVFTRTIPQIPPIYSPDEWARLTQGRTLHELGPISNICADWGIVLSQGLLGRKRAALATRARCQSDPQTVEFLDAALETIDATLALAARYAAEARQQGREDLAAVLDHVPANPPRTFHEALQGLRLLHSVVWFGGHYHVGIGRFDQFMWPYLKADLDAGRLDIAGAEDLLAEFFISLNKDSDLYPGVQQGDNGQTLTIGGVTRDGQDGCNELTRMVLRVARDVAMIDPKINLRISSETDLDLLSLATELTRKGLGFPQYSNDDVVIPALIAHGYDVEDARNYTVAACWEFIIPGKGLDVVNIGAVSFPAAVDQAIREGLDHHETFEQILARTAADVQVQASKLVDSYSRLFLPPAPFYSVVMDGCLERGQDLSAGLKYNNFGIHGACGANAADALAAVQQFVFTDHSVEPGELLNALDTNYAGYERLRKKLQDEAPKVGKNSEQADALLVRLFDDLADACESLSGNGHGRVVRPGTGTAMYYIWLARGQDGMREPVVGATAEGRQQGDFFSANLSPSTGVRADGPFSVFQSFAKIDYRRICNGGPITLELSDSVFRDSESIRKVAMLVRTFAQLGCQQLQINSLNAATLIDAQAHPENHANLIVRVWGWSGYFCELAPEYQDHIITRQLYAEAG
jgi:formate C-acetyltransferase